MVVDVSRLRKPQRHDRRSWHGMAFIVEALVLLAFLVASLAVLIQLMGAAQERGMVADELSNAIVLASNDAEAFAARPTDDDATSLFALSDGALVEIVGAPDRAEEANVGDSGAVYEVVRTVERRVEAAGTLYEAHIEVACDGRTVYGLDTSRYVSNEGVAQ